MTYHVKELFYTLQGEGLRAGRAAVFMRFAGCNLWSGLERDREHAQCHFCDTDFIGTDGVGGGKFETAQELAQAAQAIWDQATRSAGTQEWGRPYVVCTGGEPLLQLDRSLIDALHAVDFEIAVETNGTVVAPAGIDWICVSPKGSAPVLQNKGQELKLVFPQANAMPEQFTQLEFEHFLLQPMDGPLRAENTRHAIQYCLTHPKWKLSLQTHKLLGIP